MLSIVKLTDVNGEPLLKLELPQLRLGDPVQLRFAIKRRTGGRTESLEACHVFRVTQVGYDTSALPHRQLLSVEVAQGRPPVWKSVKAPPSTKKRLSPAVSPRTKI